MSEDLKGADERNAFLTKNTSKLYNLKYTGNKAVVNKKGGLTDAPKV